MNPTPKFGILNQRFFSSKIHIHRMRVRILKIWSSMRIRNLDNKKKSPNFSKHIYSISLISKSKILLIFKSEPKP